MTETRLRGRDETAGFETLQGCSAWIMLEVFMNKREKLELGLSLARSRVERSINCLDLFSSLKSVEYTIPIFLDLAQ